MSITWNGVSSDTIGVIVERIPNRYVPTRRFSPQQVAGRNGNILLVDKSFPNVEQEYEVYLSAEAQGLPSVARACAEWLMGPDGYCRLEDSYDTTVYREAFLMGGYDLENILNKFGRCTITFSCKPQKYLLTGDTPIEIPAGITTYTGDVVQFDGVTGASITSLSTTITPTQDLHGYSQPWPAGGGVNKLDPVAVFGGASSIYDVNADGTVTVKSSDSRSWGNVPELQLPAGTYNISKENATGLSAVRLSTEGYSKDHYFNPVGGYTFTFSEPSSIKVKMSYASATYPKTEKPQIVIGQTAPTVWTPYSNICPISGRTGLSVYVSPTTAQADATTYSVDWTSQAGTVYGGTLDVVTGQLVVTHAIEDLGNITWGKDSNRAGVFYGAITGRKNSSNVLACSEYTVRNLSVTTAVDMYVSGFSSYGGGLIFVRDTRFASNTGAEYKAGATGIKVVYELATPLTYQLTPQEVEVLVGKNNVWTSSGPVSVTVEAPFVGTVTNPTPFEARPMLEVSGVGEITINGKTIQILESVSDFNIDCEAMEAEDNSKIYCMDFPELSGGENEIVGDGSITALTVTPRWWIL